MNKAIDIVTETVGLMLQMLWVYVALGLMVFLDFLFFLMVIHVENILFQIPVYGMILPIAWGNACAVWLVADSLEGTLRSLVDVIKG